MAVGYAQGCESSSTRVVRCDTNIHSPCRFAYVWTYSSARHRGVDVSGSADGGNPRVSNLPKNKPHITVNLDDLSAHLTTQVMTRDLLCPLDPDGLVVLCVFPVGEGEIRSVVMLHQVRSTIDDGLLELLVQLRELRLDASRLRDTRQGRCEGNECKERGPEDAHVRDVSNVQWR